MIDMKIIFTCTGNTCRSPMAEGIFKKLCKERNFDADISSCGIFAVDGENVTPNAVEVCKEIDVDISGHTAVNIRHVSFDDVDIIVPMTQSHAAMLAALGLAEKTKRLNTEIPDPYMGGREVYRECRDRLKAALTVLCDEIVDTNTAG